MTRDFLLGLGCNEEVTEKILKTASEELKDYISADEHEAEINAVKKDNAIETGILKASGRNVKAIKALIDTDKITMDENGTFSGIDEQIKSIMKTDSYLFGKEETRIEGTGAPKGGAASGRGRYYEIDKAMGINY